MNDFWPASRSRDLKPRASAETAVEEITIGIYLPDAFLTEGASKRIAHLIKSSGLDIVNAQHIKKHPREQNVSAVLERMLADHCRKDDEWLAGVGRGIIKSGLLRRQPVGKTDLEYGRDVWQKTIAHMMSGKIRVIAYAGENAVEKLLALTGAAEPASAAPGTIRRLFSADSYALAAAENRALRSVFDCSDNLEEAKRQYEIWFGKNSYWF